MEYIPYIDKVPSSRKENESMYTAKETTEDRLQKVIKSDSEIRFIRHKGVVSDRQ